MQIVLKHNATNFNLVMSNVKSIKTLHNGVVLQFDESHLDKFREYCRRLNVARIEHQLNTFKYASNLVVNFDYNNFTLVTQ